MEQVLEHPVVDRQYIGAPLTRKEDWALLTGQATFVADIQLPGMLQAVFVRSPHAHARIRRISVEAARAMPGVSYVFTAKDIGSEIPSLGRGTKPSPFHIRTAPPLNGEVVHYVGEPVAVVLAQSQHIAEDAAELVEIDYDVLPACVDIESAATPEAPLVHDTLENNVAAWMEQSTGDVEKAFAGAPHVLHAKIRAARGAAHPMETRGVVAAYDRVSGLTISATTQGAHRLQRGLSQALKLPIQSIRVVTPHVGGSFGSKGGLDAEMVTVAWAAKKIGRPVRWIEDRLENAMAARREGDQVHDVAIAVDGSGKILGFRDTFLHEIGAYFNGIVTPWISLSTIPGPYHVPNFQARFQAVYTHKVPMLVIRGAGRPQAVLVMETMMDLVARHLHLDSAAVRRRNMIQPDEMPYDTGLLFRDNRPMIYDSGDYPKCLQKALELADYAHFEDYRQRAREDGRQVGIGIACAIEGTGIGPYETATVRLERDGSVLVRTGATSSGQGHQTTYSQICAEALGVCPDSVTVITGDTANLASGVGTFASRSTVTAGNAIFQASLQLKDRILQHSAKLLNTSAQTLRLVDGLVIGEQGQNLSLQAVAESAWDLQYGFSNKTDYHPVLEVEGTFAPEQATYTFCVQVVVVAVDPQTGKCTLERFVMVHDCGRVVNPLLLAGQAKGGVVHGIGNALYDEVVYDAQGQPLNLTFLDYLLPGIYETPRVTLDHMESPTPLNPLGVKGGGESGTIPAPAAIANAVRDALGLYPDPAGENLRTPLTPERVWEWAQGQTHL